MDKERLIMEENRNIRMVRFMTDFVVRLLMTTPMSRDEADALINGARRFTLTLFPDKGRVFDLIYLPRFRRALDEAAGSGDPAAMQFTGEAQEQCLI